MRDLFKNLLGLLIFLTIIYTLYLIYSVTDFLNSEESRIKVSDYEQEIFQKERDLDSLRNEFNKKWDLIKNQGFDSTFKRMWEFYLSYCEAGFKSKNIDLIQFSLQNK